jgi:hypothetical protein
VRSADVVARWLHFHILSIQCAVCPTQYVINVFKCGRYLRVYFLNNPNTKHVTIFMDENLTLQMKMVSSSLTVVLNHVQWLIQVTFKDHIPRDVIYELCDSQYTLDFLYSWQHMRIMSYDVLYYWISCSGHLMELASSCINMQVTKLFKLRDDLVQWRNKRLESESFFTLLKKVLLILKQSLVR